MTHPTPSFTYYGSQAGQLLDQAASQLQYAFDRISRVLHSLGNNVRAASYGLRQEVPFERWFFNHGFDTPITDPVDLIKAHAWALPAACEGAIRTTAEIVAYIFSTLCEPRDTPRHLDVLQAQWQGFTLSLLAIISPNSAKTVAHNSGRPLIGCSLLNWKWGTLYTGKLDVPLWHIECKQYPHADRPVR